MIRGRARVSTGGALAVMDRLAEFYLGPGERYPWRDAPAGLVIRVVVDRVYGTGSWRTSGEADPAEGDPAEGDPADPAEADPAEGD